MRMGYGVSRIKTRIKSATESSVIKRDGEHTTICRFGLDARARKRRKTNYVER